MANKSPDSKGPVTQTTLQRGKACLRCRKRKMKCDGVKPACQQCCRAKKPDGCEYDDGKGKTRTQLLREEVMRLTERVRELEGADHNPSSVVLHDPHSLRSLSASTSSSYDSSDELPSPPFLLGLKDSHDSPHGSWSTLPTTSSPSPVPMSQPVFFPDHHVQLPPRPEIALYMLDIFATHQHQTGLPITLQPIRERLVMGQQPENHPVLMNAIFMWACFFSRGAPLFQHQEHYLAHTLDHLRQALHSGSHLIDIIQASCLLANYFFANGRLLEGGYHASSAATLAVQHGLHEMSSTSKDIYDLRFSTPDLRMSQRTLTFWQVYNLDLSWSVVTRRPSLLPDSHTIECPWPTSEYQLDNLTEPMRYRTIGAFLEGQFFPTALTPSAMRVKATALFARSDAISSSWTSVNMVFKTSSSIMEDSAVIENVISQFQSDLLPVHQLSTADLSDKYETICSHLLVQASVLRLHSTFARDDPVSFGKCSHAAKACANIVRQVSKEDLSYLDPIVMPCLNYAADALIMELDALEKGWIMMGDANGLRSDIGTILYALTTLSTQYPLANRSLPIIQKRLDQVRVPIQH